MKKTNLLLAALAVCLILTAAIGTAWAYFTTYAEAKGGYVIHLGNRTPPPHLEERFAAWVKYVRVVNDENGEPVFVRVRAYGPEKYPLSYLDENNNWTRGSDGWYYYNEPLQPGQRTPELQIKINDVPEKAEYGEDFNVAVVFESVAAQTAENGELYADWEVTAR